MTPGPRYITQSVFAVPMILVIGNLRSWQNAGRQLPDIDGFHFSGFHALNFELMLRLQPGLVLSPLMAENFDGIDIARLLQQLGFGGAYRAVTNDLPNPHGVVAELRRVAPAVDINLFFLSNLRQI